MKEKITNYILSNEILRKVSASVLHSSIIVKNPVYKYLYSKKINDVIAKYKKFPLEVAIETTNVCNLQCINCPNSSMKRKKGFMDMKLYNKCIDECYEIGINCITLTGVGEPLLNTQIDKQISYAKNKGIHKVSLSSNAICLTNDISERLINSGLDELCISIDAAKESTYFILRPPAKLEVVENNLKEFIKFRNKLHLSTPEITVRFERNAKNFDEIGLFKAKWKNYVDHIYIGFTHNWAGSVSRGSNEWHNSSIREPCSMVFTYMSIFWDGRVPLCCLDSECETSLGSIVNNSIGEIWHSESFEKIREQHLNNYHDSIIPCNKCSLRSTFWIY